MNAKPNKRKPLDTRLLLSHCPATHTEIAHKLGVGKERVRRHLKALERAGLVKSCGRFKVRYQPV